MAGMGKRLRPHTLTTAKPLIHIAGKPIVEQLVEDIVAVCKTKVHEIAFVTGRFGEVVEKRLIGVAEQLGAKGSIHYQDEALYVIVIQNKIYDNKLFLHKLVVLFVNLV